MLCVVHLRLHLSNLKTWWGLDYIYRLLFLLYFSPDTCETQNWQATCFLSHLTPYPGVWFSDNVDWKNTLASPSESWATHCQQAFSSTCIFSKEKRDGSPLVLVGVAKFKKKIDTHTHNNSCSLWLSQSHDTSQSHGYRTSKVPARSPQSEHAKADCGISFWESLVEPNLCLSGKTTLNCHRAPNGKNNWENKRLKRI